ncbi:glycosyltransferase [Myxacorys almedinensis]|uniref:Glycosyltransferase n=1 Tax=Myxacorys almedinensis A TaxID=2690445 RepID=A0A8J7Z1C0_9CYAN|nr:glycosyltransferase [Myxacorys almedinensis]NDJ16366.1 glycosyltransferase [Myxacorys almedinensis A]
MLVIQIVLSVLIFGSIAFYLACAWFTYQFFSSITPSVSETDEPVSILVPICGLDEGALENWTSLCEQDYPSYEVLFGVVDTTDPAIPTLRKLEKTYPDRVRVMIDLPPRGINHKDSTLSYLLEKAQFETLIFADSDICVTAQYIRTVTAPLSQVDVVTCAYIAHNPKFLGAALASLGRCCDFIPSAFIARAMDGGLKFAIGVTIATRKPTLEGFGGLQLNRIGSDYNLGKRAAQAGYQVELSELVLESDTGRETIGQLVERELRWARTIRFNRGLIYYTMMFCYGTVLCLPLLLISGFAPWAIALTGLTLGIRYGQAAIAVLMMNSPLLLRWFWALPLRDGLSFAIWAMGAFGRQVQWRGRRLTIAGDGLIQPLDTSV